MAKELDVESLTKKLKNVASTQDSIAMFSLWIIHHKAHHDLIVNTWLEIVKTSKPKHRLTLWYLANDVIQNCSRKKSAIFKDSFANVLPEAIEFMRNPTILPGVERVFKVWSNRNVYDTEIIDQLHAALLTNRPPDKLRQKLLVEYKPLSLIESITAFKKYEDMVIFEEKHLKNIRVDASSSDDIHKLKDKIGGEKFSRNFEESAIHMKKFITQYEKYAEERKALLESLSRGTVFYHAQYHEAKIVVNAYQSFNSRVKKMKKLLDEVKDKFSPNLSPAREGSALMNRSDDIADMDMSDSDQELGEKPSNIVSVDTNISRPIPVHTSQKESTASAADIKSLPPSNFGKLNKIITTVSNESQQSAGIINRPGMRGASSSVLILSSMPEDLPVSIGTTPSVNIPVNIKTTKMDFSNKIHSPSASPPSPTDSPELNISSPPRHQSLESRLADIFSGNQKGVIVTGTENTGSESEAESIPPVQIKNALFDQPPSVNEVSLSTTQSVISPSVSLSYSLHDPAKSSQDETSWQNIIPVIGGNRNLISLSTPVTTHSAEGRTPLQDEQPELYFVSKEEKETKNIDAEHVPSNFSLPPPSFSGDALNFLSKFMGQKTKTNLSQASHFQSSNWSPQNEKNKIEVKSDNSGINWNTSSQSDSPRKTTSADMNWLHQSLPSVSNISSMRNGSNGDIASVKEQDTDYRMMKVKDHHNGNNKEVFVPVHRYETDSSAYNKEATHAEVNRESYSTTIQTSLQSTPESENQFMNILRKKSLEKTPDFPPMSSSNSIQKKTFPDVKINENLIVEEEIVMEVDANTENDGMRRDLTQTEQPIVHEPIGLKMKIRNDRKFHNHVAGTGYNHHEQRFENRNPNPYFHKPRFHHPENINTSVSHSRQVSQKWSHSVGEPRHVHEPIKPWRNFNDNYQTHDMQRFPYENNAHHGKMPHPRDFHRGGRQRRYTPRMPYH